MPGMWVKIEVSVCECWAAAERPAPYMVRMTTGVSGLAPEHVAELGRLVEDLVEADAQEVDEHQLRDRAHAARGRADGGTGERGLRQRRIEQAVAILLVEALVEPEGAAPCFLFARAAGSPAVLGE